MPHETLSDYVGQLAPTTSIGTLAYSMPRSLEEMFETSGSEAGFSSTSDFLTCPEHRRLKRLGVTLAGFSELWLDELPAWAFGVLMHALLHRRMLADDALSFLEDGNPGYDLVEADRQEAQSLVQIYDDLYPKAHEDFEILALEKEVVTDLGDGVQITVRYDGVVRSKRGIHSFEKKTSGKGGDRLWDSYSLKSAWQITAWNMNSALVKAYGPMTSVILDTIVRTKVPKFSRDVEHFIPFEQQKRMALFAKYARKVQYPIEETNDLEHTPIPGPAAFRNKSACYGLYNSKCVYFDLCHFGDASPYVVKDQ